MKFLYFYYFIIYILNQIFFQLHLILDPDVNVNKNDTNSISLLMSFMFGSFYSASYVCVSTAGELKTLTQNNMSKSVETEAIKSGKGAGGGGVAVRATTTTTNNEPDANPFPTDIAESEAHRKINK